MNSLLEIAAKAGIATLEDECGKEFVAGKDAERLIDACADIGARILAIHHAQHDGDRIELSKTDAVDLSVLPSCQFVEGARLYAMDWVRRLRAEGSLFWLVLASRQLELSGPIRLSVAAYEKSRLWDYGWFDLTRFQIGEVDAANPTPADVVEAFRHSPWFPRALCTSPDPWGARLGTEEPRSHGPFRIPDLPRPAYQALAEGDLRERVAEIWRAQGSPMPGQLEPLDAWLECRRTEGHHAFELIGPDSAKEDWSFVWSCFHEFVSVDPERNHLSVAIIGYD